MDEVGAAPLPVTISDPQVMRALAHPARLGIMEHLGSTGDSVTATECAEVVGLSPSATSYHLRALARYGLVEQAPGRGDARERRWRSTAHAWRIDSRSDAEPETRAAEKVLIEAFVTRDFERVRDWVRRMPDEPREWYDAAALTGTVLFCTADELRDLNDALHRLLEPYKRLNRRSTEVPGARPVVIHYAALPQD